MASLWDTIVNDIKGVFNVGQTVSGTVAAAGTSIGAQQVAGIQAPNAVQGLEQAAKKSIATTLGTGAVSSPGTDILLKASKPVADVLSPIVTRPVSTFNLLSNPDSPLYEQNQYGKGFQLSDVKKAYDRTAKVSLGQSFTQSPLFQSTPFGKLADNLLEKGNINLEKVNLWDNKDIKKNFADNPWGRVFTGSLDFVGSNVALGFAGGITKNIASNAAKFTNLTSSVTTAEDLARYDKLATDHITGISKTVFGNDVEQLAKSNDINFITNKIMGDGILNPGYSNNERLPGLIAKQTDPSIIKDYLLADKNYAPAIERLANHKPTSTDAWELGDMNAYIKGATAATGKLPVFEGEYKKKVIDAFDQSIAENPSHQAIYDAFLSPDGELKSLGKNYLPVDPAIGAPMINAVRNKFDSLAAQAVTRDFGGISETLIGSGVNRPVTSLVRFTTTKKPLGYITFSGSRPWDSVQETHALFDSMPLFKNGKNDIVVGNSGPATDYAPIIKKASDFRNEFMMKLTDAQTPSQKAALIDELDNSLGEILANSYGIKASRAEVEQYLGDIRASIRNTHAALVNEGFAFDAQGRRMVTEPVTQRQLTDSIAMLPWDKINRDIITKIRNAKIPASGTLTTGASDLLHQVFNSINKVASMSMLGKPAYIPKNSGAEPLLASVLSLGHTAIEDSVGTAISHAITNNKNRIMSQVTKLGDKIKTPQATKEVNDGFEKLNQAMNYRDDKIAEWVAAFENKTLSPAAEQEHLPIIQKELREAQSLVAKVEDELGTAIKPYGKLEQIPSLYTLRERLEFLKKQPGVVFSEPGIYAEKIRKMQGNKLEILDPMQKAELAIRRVVGSVNTLSPDLAARNSAIEEAWKGLNKVVEDNKLGLKEQGELLAKRAKYKQRLYGSENAPVTLKVGNQTLNTESIFDENKFGSAIRSEFSNEATQEIQFLGERRIGNKVSMLARKGPTGTVDVNSPLYFDELAWMANRHVKGEILMQKILEGKDRQDLIDWANGKEGIAYLKQFEDLRYRSDIENIVDEKINFVQSYFPDEAIRKLIASKEVTGPDLQKVLAEKLDTLKPIHPLDVDYPTAATSSLNKIKSLGENMSDLSNAAWKKMANAENPIRWAWAEKRAPQILEQKLNLAFADAKEPISEATVNAMKQASVRDALQEAEKTFYTLGRQNKAIYAARTILAFPNASANAVYRFGRLAVINPTRMAQFMYNYYEMYKSFGVDKNGNPVDNPLDASYIVVPGTREMGINHGEGLLLSTKSVGFLVNMPGPSWLLTLGVNKILASKPDLNETTKHVWDNTVGHIPSMKYDNFFPSGITSTGIATAFYPQWAQNLSRYIHGSQSDKDYHDTWQLTNAYAQAMWHEGLGPKPTYESVTKDTQNWYLNRAAWQFGSLIGMAPKANRPGQVFADMATALAKKYNGDYNKVQQEMQSVLGPNFPTDYFTFKGKTKAAYIAPTYEGYLRIWKQFPDIATNLTKLGPEMAGLLTSDLTGDPDPQILKFLADPKTKLPNGHSLNLEPLTPQEYESKIQVNRVWDTYRKNKDALLSELQKRGIKNIGDNPDVKAAWDKYINQLSLYNKDWGNEYLISAGGDNAIKYATGLKTIVADPNFWAKHSNDDYWKQVKTFLKYRDTIIKAYDEAPFGTKGKVQQAWVNWLQEKTARTWNPQLQQIIDRYFIGDKLKGTL